MTPGPNGMNPTSQAERVRIVEATGLAHGPHAEPCGSSFAGCVLEAASWVAGEPWSDHPAGVSPVIAAFLRCWNDALPDTDRVDLLPHVAGIIGSRSSADTETHRAMLALDWLVRTHTTAWLARVPSLADRTARLRAMPPLDSETAGMALREIVSIASVATATADAAVLEATELAQRRATPAEAPWAGRSVGRATAGGPSSMAANASAGSAARSATFQRLGDSPAMATADAAWAGAQQAARYVAATAPFGEVTRRLAPTVLELQVSAHGLLDRMIRCNAELGDLPTGELP